jgi:hypothetical protein
LWLISHIYSLQIDLLDVLDTIDKIKETAFTLLVLVGWYTHPRTLRASTGSLKPS